MKEEFDNKSTIYKIYVNVGMILSLFTFKDLYIFFKIKKILIIVMFCLDIYLYL